MVGMPTTTPTCSTYAPQPPGQGGDGLTKPSSGSARRLTVAATVAPALLLGPLQRHRPGRPPRGRLSAGFSAHHLPRLQPSPAPALPRPPVRATLLHRRRLHGRRQRRLLAPPLQASPGGLARRGALKTSSAPSASAACFRSLAARSLPRCVELASGCICRRACAANSSNALADAADRRDRGRAWTSTAAGQVHRPRRSGPRCAGRRPLRAG